MAPTPELVRFVAGPGGPEPGAGRKGRGAWICASEGCAERALRRGALAGALRLDRSLVEAASEVVHTAVAQVARGADRVL